MTEEVITTGEFVLNAKHLYRTAIHATKAWRIYTDAPTAEQEILINRMKGGKR